MTTRSLPVCLARRLGLIAGQIPDLTGVWSNLTSSRAAPAAHRRRSTPTVSASVVSP